MARPKQCDAAGNQPFGLGPIQHDRRQALGRHPDEFAQSDLNPFFVERADIGEIDQSAAMGTEEFASSLVEKLIHCRK
jgi:hypothetical protein